MTFDFWLGFRKIVVPKFSHTTGKISQLRLFATNAIFGHKLCTADPRPSNPGGTFLGSQRSLLKLNNIPTPPKRIKNAHSPHVLGVSPGSGLRKANDKCISNHTNFNTKRIWRKSCLIVRPYLGVVR